MAKESSATTDSLKALRAELMGKYFAMVQPFGFGDIPEDISAKATETMEHAERVRKIIESRTNKK